MAKPGKGKKNKPTTPAHLHNHISSALSSSSSSLQPASHIEETSGTPKLLESNPKRVLSKDGAKVMSVKRITPNQIAQKLHQQGHHIDSTSPFFSDDDDDDDEIQYVSGVAGTSVEIEYAKPKQSSQSNRQIDTSQHQITPGSNGSTSGSDDLRRRNQYSAGRVSPNGSAAPPPQQPPPPPPGDKISFQEFLQSKEVAKIHDTAKKFAQIRLQQLQNDHSALTEEQRAQVHYFLENQHLLPSHMTNISTDSQMNDQYTANVNAISSLATMAAAAALHNFEKKNGAVDFLTDSEAVAIANSIKLPLPPEELNNLANFPNLSSLSNMAVKEVNEWAARELYSQGYTVTTNENNVVNIQRTQHFSPNHSTNSTAPNTSSSHPNTDGNIELTPEQQQFRQQLQQYERQQQQLDQQHKQPLHTLMTNAQSQSYAQRSLQGHSLVDQLGQVPGSLKRFKSDTIWDTSNAEEKERIRQFWHGLSYEERRELVKIPKHTVMQKMKEQKRTNCNCLMCGKKRLAIEELESLYDAYNKSEMEKQNLTKNDASIEDAASAPELDIDEVNDKDIFNFGNTLTIQGGVLTVADDLLRNNGKKFIDMMDLLQQRRQRREEAEVQAMADYDTDQMGEDEEDEFTEDDGKYEDDLEEYEGDGSEEEYEEGSETEESRWDASKRLLHKFAISIFEQRLMTAYREKVAKEREEKLLEELAEEERLNAENKEKKLQDKEKKKERKRQQRQAKEEERLKKQAEIEKEQAAVRERQRQRNEEAQRKKIEQKKKKDAERQRAVDERLKKMEEEKRKERLRKEQEEKEKEEQLLKEKKEREEKERLELQRKEEEERIEREKVEKLEKEKREKEQKEREAKEREEQRVKEELEREAKEKEEKEAEAAKAKQQHQQQLLASLKQHAEEMGAPNAVTVTSAAAAAALDAISGAIPDTARSSFSMANVSGSADISSSGSSSVTPSPAVFNPSLVNPVGIQLQFPQQQFSQPPSSDGSYYGFNITQNSNISQFSSSSSFNTSPANAWPAQNIAGQTYNQFQQAKTSISPGFHGNVAQLSQSRSISPPDNAFSNSNTPPNLSGKRISISSTPSTSTIAENGATIPLMSVITPVNGIQQSQSSGDSSRGFGSTDNLASFSSNPIGSNSPSSQQYSQVPRNRTGSVFTSGPVAVGNFSDSLLSNDVWASNSNQQNSLGSRRSSMWSTSANGNTWSSAPINSLSPSVPISGSLPSSLTAAPALAGNSNTLPPGFNSSLTTGTPLTGSLSGERFDVNDINDRASIIRDAAINAYKEYSKGVVPEGKISTHLLLALTRSNLAKSHSLNIRDHQEFHNACACPDKNGVVHFELCTGALGLVSHLRYNPTFPGLGLGNGISNVGSPSLLNSNSPTGTAPGLIQSTHSGLSLTSPIGGLTSAGLTSSSSSGIPGASLYNVAPAQQIPLNGISNLYSNGLGIAAQQSQQQQQMFPGLNGFNVPGNTQGYTYNQLQQQQSPQQYSQQFMNIGALKGGSLTGSLTGSLVSGNSLMSPSSAPTGTSGTPGSVGIPASSSSMGI